MRVIRHIRACATLLARMVDGCFILARLPYFRMYRRDTLEPAISLCKERDDAKVPELLGKWLRVEKAELEYVQIAVCCIY